LLKFIYIPLILLWCGGILPDLTTTIASLRMKNPTMLASGIMDEDAQSMKRIADSDAGAVVTKSIGISPREGYPNPTFVELEHGILNAMGLPNPGIQDIEEEIYVLTQGDTLVIGSIFGGTASDFVHLSEKMEDYGVDALELNMSCPHAKGYGLEIGSDADLVHTITHKVKDATSIPVFVKLSSNVTDIVAIARAAEEGKADAIVAINSVLGMTIDLEARCPVLSHKTGGYSGMAIKPIGVRCVYEIAQNVAIPVIGVGGITTGLDALEYIMAGATAVQIGSALYYRGVQVFKNICDEISEWMHTHKVQQLSSLIGAAGQ
jgi:dihydroorotate dehydrogenase (NAD+) catalytic subunit